MTIRVLVVDDEAIVRDGLRTIIDLEHDLEVVGEAANGEEALAAAQQHTPDVALVDIQMPVLDGIETTRKLARLRNPPKVLLLTTFDLNEYVYEGMKAGAGGFLLKDVRRGQLTDAIRAIMAGDTLIAPTVTRRLIEEFCRLPTPSASRPAALDQPRHAKSRSSPWSDAEGRTPRSPRIWWSQKRPYAHTCRGC